MGDERMRRVMSNFVGRASTAALVGCMVFVGCGGAAPLARDASGRPVFDPDRIRHPANEPYFCFSGVSRDGDDFTQCEVIKEWCARELDQSKAVGLAITAGCKEVDEVHCYVAYASGGMFNTAKGLCTDSAAQCQTLAAKQDELNGPEHVSACQRLDRSFQPTG